MARFVTSFVLAVVRRLPRKSSCGKVGDEFRGRFFRKTINRCGATKRAWNWECSRRRHTRYISKTIFRLAGVIMRFRFWNSVKERIYTIHIYLHIVISTDQREPTSGLPIVFRNFKVPFRTPQVDFHFPDGSFLVSPTPSTSKKFRYTLLYHATQAFYEDTQYRTPSQI